MVFTFGAADRNKSPILDCIRPYIVANRNSQFRMLEVASGCGQHALHFVSNIENLIIQPSEMDKDLVNNIETRRQEVPDLFTRFLSPLFIDLEKFDFETTEKNYDGLFVSNLCHISPWSTTVALFNVISTDVLVNSGLVFIYGPFAEHGSLEPESNRNFDASLRLRNGTWGIRDVDDLQGLAKSAGVQLLAVHSMPANNKVLVFKKIGKGQDVEEGQQNV